MTLAWIGIASWIIWHFIQIRSENKALDEEQRMFADKAKLEKAMNISNAETLSESMKGHASDF
jgi:hypothetical protein